MVLPQDGTLTLQAQPERVLIRPNGSHRHVLLTVSATPRGLARPRSPIALALVVDQSVLSDLAGHAFHDLLDQLASHLSEVDTLAVLTFGRDLVVLQPAAPASPRILTQLAERLASIEPTLAAQNLHGALLQGALAIATDEVRDLSRVWLITGSSQDLGTSPDTIVENATSIRQHAKVGTSVFALGNAYDSALLGRLAIAGGGQFHHLASPEDLADAAEAELRELATTVASQVAFEVATEPGITVEPVSAGQAGQLSPEGILPILLGEVPAQVERSIVIRFGFEPGDPGGGRLIRVRAAWQTDGVRQTTDWQQMVFTYADDATCNRELRNRAVMHWVGLHHAARARVLGGQRFLQGDDEAARKAVAPVAYRLRQYARGDAALERALADLQGLATVGFRSIPVANLRGLLAEWQWAGRGEPDELAAVLDQAQILTDRLASLTIGHGHSYDGMTVFPIFGPSLREHTFRTLSQAIADGSVEVVEQEMATVPELVLQNRGTAMVFILEGEEIVGGRQNRIVGQSALIEPDSTVALPVNCVEQGRWNPTSARFSSGETAYYNLRKDRQRTARKDARGRLVADQSQIWEHIATRQQTLGVRSASSAMSDIYRARTNDLDTYERVFRYPSDALGMVVALNGRLAGAEIFARRSLAGALWSKLIRSYALDASNEPSPPVVRDRAIHLLKRVYGTSVESFPPIARGQNLRFTGNGVVGSALLDGETVVHANIFREYET